MQLARYIVTEVKCIMDITSYILTYHFIAYILLQGGHKIGYIAMYYSQSINNVYQWLKYVPTKGT